MSYGIDLQSKISKGQIIEKNSLEELQIRAATIRICEKLKVLTGWNVADVDTYLWKKRRLTNEPFHCTYTTDY
jgi:hypothetical protein